MVGEISSWDALGPVKSVNRFQTMSFVRGETVMIRNNGFP